MILMAAVLLSACHAKADTQTEAQAMAEYRALTANITTQEQLDHAVKRAYELAKAHPASTLDCIILSDMHYYMSTAQKGEIVDLIPESLRQKYPQMQGIIRAIEAERHTAVGCTYTDWSAAQPNGKPLKISQLVGKTDYVLLDFWASWCGPCRASMPAMKELYTSLPKGKLEILGINMDNKAENWTNAITNLGLPWRHISDLKKWSCECAKIYGVNSIPATVLIDKKGKIVGRNLTADQVKSIISKKKK